MTRRERIAIVTTSYPANQQDPSGHFVAAQARSLYRAGHCVTVLTGGSAATCEPDPGEPDVVRLWDGGASGWPGLLPRLKERPHRGLGFLVWAWSVRRELERRGPFTRVLGHFLLPTGFPVLLATSLGGAHVELFVHGSDARLLDRLPRALGRRIVLSLAKKAHFRCVSHELADLLRRVAGESLASRLQVEPLALETAEAPTRRDARQALGLSEGTRLVVLVSRLIPEKRTREALAATALVPNVEVVVVGDGPELAALSRDYPHVRFVGRLGRPQALTFIAAADVLLSASRLEGAPSAVREARALGVPVTACAAGDLSRWAELDRELWVVAEGPRMAH